MELWQRCEHLIKKKKKNIFACDFIIIFLSCVIETYVYQIIILKMIKNLIVYKLNIFYKLFYFSIFNSVQTIHFVL